MSREQFLQALRQNARKHGKTFVVDRGKGKGSHYRVTYDGKISTVQMDLNPGRIRRILKQIGLEPGDL